MQNAASSAIRDPHIDWAALATTIVQWAGELGFEEAGIADTNLSNDEARLMRWLALGRHGAMDYMARHGPRRARPAELVPGTLRVISARMNYRPGSAHDAYAVLGDSRKAYIARYALGRDYHKVMRAKLEQF